MRTGRAETARSARAGAKRPQLVPRDRDVASAEAEQDLDAQTVASRGSSFEWPGNGTTLGTPQEPEVKLPPPSPPLQQLPPQPVAATQPASLTLDPVTYADLDRMWDWVREDNYGAKKFLGEMPEHSQALFAYMNRLLEAETKGTALIRAINVGGSSGVLHIGFIVLNPIVQSAKPSAYVHCYLSPSAQGSLPALLPTLLDIANEQFPLLWLIVPTTDYALAKLLQPHGFRLTIALTRPPKQQQG